MSVPRYLLILAVALGCTTACDDDETVLNNGDFESGFRIETEPVLAPGGDSVFIVTTFTGSPQLNGIYTAPVVRPIREEVFLMDSVHSPSKQPGGNHLAFIDGDQVRFHVLNSQNFFHWTTPERYESVIFVNDTLLVAHRGGLLIRANLSSSQVSPVGLGYDPSFVDTNNFIYLDRNRSGMTFIIQQQVITGMVDTLLALQSLNRTFRSPSLHKPSGRMAFTVLLDSTYEIMTTTAGTNEFTVIDTTEYPEVCMVDRDLMLYTGPDGRLRASNFDGSDRHLWWAPERGD